jgi:ketosteroid isomerase-like protein
MAEGDVELVLEGYAAWNRGDLQWLLDHGSPDYEWRPTQLFPGIDAVYRGHAGMEKFWSTLREPWESLRIEVDRVEDLGDAVLALFTFHGKGRDSGAEVTLRLANVFRYRDGVAVEGVSYGDWDSALEATGLAPSQRRDSASARDDER